MSRQLQCSERMFNELKDRLGENDPLVSQWQGELAMRDSFEFRYPSKWPCTGSKSADHVQRRPWSSLFERSRHTQVSGISQQLQISVDSSPGRGTRFQLILPMQAPSMEH